MRQILAMTRKELLLWAQKPGSWLLVFIIPLLFIWFMQAVFGEQGTPVVTVYAVNEDEGQAGGQVIQALRESGSLRIDELETREEADELVGDGQRMAAVVVPENFSQAVRSPEGADIEIIIDPARSEQANLVLGLVNAALGPMIVDAEVSRGVEAGVEQVLRNLQSPAAAVTATATTNPQGDAPFQIFEETPFDPYVAPGTPTPPGADDPFSSGFQASPSPTPTLEGSLLGQEPGLLEEPQDNDPARQFLTAALKGVVSSQVQEALNNPQVEMDVQAYGGQEAEGPALLDHLVPGYSLLFMFFLITNLAAAVIEERDTGALRRLLIAPVSRSRILLGKMLPYILIGAAQIVFVLIASRLAFRVDLGDAPAALLVIIFASALAMTSLGILIASFARSESQADGIAVVAILAMAVISGAVFPSIAIPGLQNLTPHYWAMQGFLNVTARGMGMDGVLMPAGVLLTMSAIFFAIGAIRFRFE